MSERIRRSPKNAENPFAQISREMLQDKTLSYEARGLLSYLLSKSGNWELRVSDLQIEGAGRDKVYRIISELQAKGYVSTRAKFQDEKGYWQWTPYDVFETPVLSPCPENPYTANPYTENTEIKEKILEDEIQNTKEERKDSAAIAAPAESPSQSDAQSVTDAVQGERMSIREEHSTKRKTQTAKDKSSSPFRAPPSSFSEVSEHLAPQESKPKTPAALLGEVYGVMPAGKRAWSQYGTVASALNDATIPCEEFDLYIKWTRRESKNTGEWEVTITALMNPDRMSKYVAARNAHKAQGSAKDGYQVGTMLNASKNAYNPRLDPAYAPPMEKSS